MPSYQTWSGTVYNSVRDHQRVFFPFTPSSSHLQFTVSSLIRAMGLDIGVPSKLVYNLLTAGTNKCGMFGFIH